MPRRARRAWRRGPCRGARSSRRPRCGYRSSWRPSVAGRGRRVTPQPPRVRARAVRDCRAYHFRRPPDAAAVAPMILKRFFDESLAQASFLLGDTETHEAIVLDPNRDVDAYLQAAAAEQLRIVAVTETHIHADYLSGTRELAQRAGARAYLSDEGDADWKYAWAGEPNVPLVREDGASNAGGIRRDVLATPGHTPEHLSFRDAHSRRLPLGHAREVVGVNVR